MSTRMFITCSALLVGLARTAPAQVEGNPAGRRETRGTPQVVVTVANHRPDADLDGNRQLEGEEMLPLYQRAARDFLQALFAYGPPRLVRLGVQLEF